MRQSETVFPHQNVDTAGSSSFKLPAGQHAFDFNFTLPEFTDCISDHKSQSPSYLLSKNKLLKNCETDVQVKASKSERHNILPLPPSLSGITNDNKGYTSEHFAVRYFLHGVVHFSSLTTTTLRILQPIVYLPPEEQNTTHETIYDIRKLPVWKEAPSKAFISSQESGSLKKAFKSIFGSSESSHPPPSFPFLIEFESPKRVKRTGPVPFKITFYSQYDIRKMGDFNTLYITELDFRLRSITDGRAASRSQTIKKYFDILSEKNLNFPLPFSQFVLEKSPKLGPVWKAEIPQYLWEKAVIPDNVCPSFTSCAVTHSFTFDLRIGISIIPNTYPSFADFSSDVVITSGISKPATTYYHPPGYESGDVDLPTYRDALEGNDGAAAPSNVFQRRIYTQYKDYFAYPEKRSGQHIFW